MKQPTKTVYRTGDTVVVKTPEIFIRCGYPKHLDSESEYVANKYGELINDTIAKCGIKKNTLFNGKSSISRSIIREIAHARLRQCGFGGRKREIYTETKEELRDKAFLVIDKKVVKTGTYHYGTGYGEDYDPPSLENTKCHVILLLAGRGHNFWIESKNVAKEAWYE